MTPVLVYADVRGAVEWLERAFGFEERVRIGEAHRSQMQVGEDGAIVVTDSTAVVKIRVPDVDEACARAQAAGGQVVEEPRTWEYGERSCVVEDPAGHRWELTQTVRDVDPAEWGGEGSW